MARKPDAATFFSSDENFTLEHQFADILEADRQFEKLKAEFRADAGNDQALRVRPRHRAPPALVAIDVEQQER